MKKIRIDKLLVERGLVETRERARAMIMAGDVLVEDTPVHKAGTGVQPDATVRFRRPDHPYVGRGGVKLRGALDEFGIDPQGLVAADIGCSTGGFTDCLLAAGARCVYALDVDTSQLDWKLQSDSRVVPIEGNARYLDPGSLMGRMDLVTIDVSFISLRKILPRVTSILTAGGRVLALVKPQFELGPEKVPKGGVVSDPALHQAAVDSITSWVHQATGLGHVGTVASPITGKEGNREFFVLLSKS